MTEKKANGKIIPFRQETAFYMKRGAKQMEKNDLLSALCRHTGSISAALRRLPRCAAFIFIRIAGIVRLIRCQCCILPSMMSFRVHFTLYLPSPANKPAIRCAIENTLKASARARIQTYYTIR